MKYEYRILERANHRDMENLLNGHGEAGWRVVAFGRVKLPYGEQYQALVEKIAESKK